MARPRYKPVTPDKRIRELRKEFKALRKGKGEEEGVERAKRLASFTRDAHRERQLNMAMHAAQMCLDKDPDAPDLLVTAYLGDLDGGDDRDDREALLRALLDLRDLARYLDRDDLRTLSNERFDEEARSWIRSGDEPQRRHRLRTLASMAGQETADTIRDELRFLED